MKRKRQFTARVLALLLAAVLLGGTVPLGITAADTIAVSPTALTTIVLADACEAFGHIDGGEGQLYVETTLGDPYFDRVRPGDRIDLKVRVEKAGTYRWCVVSGWAKDAANGTFRLFLDGEQITEPLANQVPGIDWRTWQDSTPGTVKLPAGEHTLSLVTDTAGPNLYALKLAPEGVELSVPEGTVPLCEADSNTPVQVYTDYAIQFCMTVPFDYVTVAAPSYNNNKGSFRLELFRWTESYSKTVGGQALATQDFIDFNDNATLKLKFGHNMDAGEYVLRLTNISEDANEQIGVWTSPTAPENVRNYQGGIEVANAARMNVHYFGSTDKPLAGISPAQGERAPVYEEIRESMKDLTRYGLPATSRYLTAELMPDTWVFTDALGARRCPTPRWVTRARIGRSRCSTGYGTPPLPDCARPSTCRSSLISRRRRASRWRITSMTSIMPAGRRRPGRSTSGISRSMATTARMMCGYSAGRRSFWRRRAWMSCSRTTPTLRWSGRMPTPRCTRPGSAPSRTG